MDLETRRVIGSIYIALCSALSEQGVELANDVLLLLADDPKTPAREASIYRKIASANRDRDENGKTP